MFVPPVSWEECSQYLSMVSNTIPAGSALAWMKLIEEFNPKSIIKI